MSGAIGTSLAAIKKLLQVSPASTNLTQLIDEYVSLVIPLDVVLDTPPLNGSALSVAPGAGDLVTLTVVDDGVYDVWAGFSLREVTAAARRVALRMFDLTSIRAYWGNYLTLTAAVAQTHIELGPIRLLLKTNWTLRTTATDAFAGTEAVWSYIVAQRRL
jgi:hypothetical protein